ncbi:MAG: cobalamin-dependent protein, partial [Myxococcota bacterium]|nr:cobalamin-dependent protein [Myxococcota bacterium]
MRRLEQPGREGRAVRIALVWPRGFDPATTLPLPFGYLKAGLDPLRYDVRILDCALERLGPESPELGRWLEGFAPDLVGLSTWSPMFPEVLALLDTVRRCLPEAVTVLGGAHPSSYAERCLECPQVDYVVAGEAQRAFAVLVDELQRSRPRLSKVPGLVWRKKNGSLGRNEMERPELDSIALPD